MTTIWKHGCVLMVVAIVSCDSRAPSARYVTQYEHFRVIDTQGKTVIRGNNNKLVAILNGEQLDSQTVFVSSNDPGANEWRKLWEDSHKIFRWDGLKVSRIYSSSIDLSGALAKIFSNIDALRPNEVDMILVLVDEDMSEGNMRRFIGKVGDAELRIAFNHTNVARYKWDNMLFWEDTK